MKTNTQENLVTMIPFNQLVEDPENVRKTSSKASMEALAANIAAHGLLQNLLVRKVDNKKFAVGGGERRRQALGMLVADGKLGETHPVPCVIKEGPITSISLSENVHRAAMHPADEFVAYKDMIDSGMTVKEVAAIHGVAKKKVEQRLTLGRLSPVVLNAYREGKIDKDDAKAFTLTSDTKRQERVFETLSPNCLSAYRISNAITDGEIESDEEIARFVGREAYEEAGGIIRENLFGDEVFFKDGELLTKLATEDLQEEAENLLADGWKWIDVQLERDFYSLHKMDRIYPETVKLSKTDEEALERVNKRLDELNITRHDNEADRDAWNKLFTLKKGLEEKTQKYKASDKAIAGGIVSIWNGKLCLDLGFVRPEDNPALQEEKAKKAEEKANNPVDCGVALSDDLAAIRLEIFRIELVKNPVIASDLLNFHLIKDILTTGFTDKPFDLSTAKPYGPRTQSEKGDMGVFSGRDEYERLVSELPMKWFKIKDQIKSFDAFRALSAEDKARLQSYAAALMLNPQLAGEKHAKPTLEHAAVLMETHPQDYWTPNEDCFKRMTKTQMFGIAKDVIGAEFIAKHEKSKKGEIAAALGREFVPPKDSKQKREKSVIDKISAWLPRPMRVGK
ncbi:hypothetical protein WH95_20010 [Kiloniella litopenaei]|uniref:ParB-like N-terminal domain-containing protein n=1 Tax=Kiloniella litopenaei TaxID=1549748 RepID=A0A0M2R3Y3_9PROT|nr:ParB/RepB/Spo0J family partition protein [Kiloniella litopenaei]KKJ75139.1 hypothetical protein WH95_20010 [Kiloniella litopenaei]